MSNAPQTLADRLEKLYSIHRTRTNPHDFAPHMQRCKCGRMYWQASVLAVHCSEECAARTQAEVVEVVVGRLLDDSLDGLAMSHDRYIGTYSGSHGRTSTPTEAWMRQARQMAPCPTCGNEAVAEPVATVTRRDLVTGEMVTTEERPVRCVPCEKRRRAEKRKAAVAPPSNLTSKGKERWRPETLPCARCEETFTQGRWGQKNCPPCQHAAALAATQRWKAGVMA